MGCQVLRKLEGKHINGEMRGPDGKMAKILHAVKVKDFFDDDRRTELTICYAHDEAGDLIAYLGKHPAENKKAEKRGHWKFKHIQDLNREGIAGFADYAKKVVGIMPAQLIHLVIQNRPKEIPLVLE